MCLPIVTHTFYPCGVIQVSTRVGRLLTITVKGPSPFQERRLLELRAKYRTFRPIPGGITGINAL